MSRSIAVALVLIVATPVLADEKPLTPVRGEEGLVYIDVKGKVAIRGPFAKAAPFGEGLAGVRDLEGAAYLIDAAGKRVADLPEGVVVTGPFRGGLARARRGGESGFVDRAGAWAFGIEGDARDDFTGDWVRIDQGKTGGFSTYNLVNREGKHLFEQPCWSIHPSEEGLAAVQTESRTPFGFVDETGRWVLERKYADAGPFSDGLAAVAIDPGAYAYIDRSGKVVIPGPFGKAHPFHQGVAPVFQDGKWGLIDRRGRWVVKPTFEWMDRFFEGVACVGQGERHGLVDTRGRVVMKPMFESPLRLENGLAEVRQDGKTLYVNGAGKVVWREER